MPPTPPTELPPSGSLSPLRPGPIAMQLIGRTIQLPEVLTPSYIDSLALPAGTRFHGGRVVDEDHVVVWYQIGETAVFLVGKHVDRAVSRIEVVTGIDIEVAGGQVVMSECADDGVSLAPLAIALIAPTSSGADWPAVRAWLIDPGAWVFREVSTDGIICHLGAMGP